MKSCSFQRVGRLGLSFVLGGLAYAGSYAQTLQPPNKALKPATLNQPSISPSISFDKQAISEIRTEGLPETERNLIAKMPADFYHFGAVKAGAVSEAQPLTLRFAIATKLTGIHSTPDFTVEQGGSCVAGNVYEAKSSCVVLVRFTPQGPGHRLGKLTVAHSAAAEPLSVGLNGFGYAPVVSFTPALITTVPGTFSSGEGLLNNSKNLAVDGGDALYIADTGNNLVRYMDSSGAITTIAGGGTQAVSGIVNGLAAGYKLNGPYGIAVDGSGDAYVSDSGDDELLYILPYGYLESAAGGGNQFDGCSLSSPCSPTAENISTPQGVTIDPFGNPFFYVGQSEIDEIEASPFGLAFVNAGYAFQPALLFDASDNLYTAFEAGAGVVGFGSPADCYIVGQNPAFTDYLAGSKTWIVAGTRTCGFSGDGGQARNAEIGGTVSQMAMDLAGNLYFSDTANQRVRRIDASTGIIHTIAGDGVAGYAGDGGQATSATLRTPTGVAVDSQGQVYIASGSSSTSSAQVVRKVGPNGALTFASQLKGSASAAHTVTVANTGNDGLEGTTVAITGAAAGDFSMDPNTTSCNFGANSYYSSGQSCVVGVIFKPTAGGTRTANLVLLDNTVTNSNTVQLSGTGTLPAPTFTIAAPAAGATVTWGGTVKFSASVTSASGTAPTGSVTFSVDGKAFGSPVTLASGAASVNLTGLTVATHTLSAAYSGDANYATATASRTLIVRAAAVKSKVALTAKANPAASGKPLEFVAMVEAGSKSEPRGEICLREGKKELARAALEDGKASINVPKLSAGTHMLTAVYGGDSEHKRAESPELKEVVR
jgi:sugar lactone lactonase YvrE